MQIVEHDFVERLKEVLLEREGSELFTYEELVRQLSKRIDCKDGYIQVWMRAHMFEVLGKRLPDLVPHEADARHIEICHFNERLQREFSGGVWASQLIF